MRDLLNLLAASKLWGCACRRTSQAPNRRPLSAARTPERSLDCCAALAREESWMRELGFVRAGLQMQAGLG